MQGDTHQLMRFNRRRQPSMKEIAGAAVLDATERFHCQPVAAIPMCVISPDLTKGEMIRTF